MGRFTCGMLFTAKDLSSQHSLPSTTQTHTHTQRTLATAQISYTRGLLRQHLEMSQRVSPSSYMLSILSEWHHLFPQESSQHWLIFINGPLAEGDMWPTVPGLVITATQIANEPNLGMSFMWEHIWVSCKDVPCVYLLKRHTITSNHALISVCGGQLHLTHTNKRHKGNADQLLQISQTLSYYMKQRNNGPHQK